MRVVAERHCGFRNFFVYKKADKINSETRRYRCQYSLGFSVREDVRLEICRLGEFLVASVEGTDVGSISGVDTNVSAEKDKIQLMKAQLSWSDRYRKLKSSENLFPQPSNVHWNGFSPVWTSWCRFNLELSTNAFPKIPKKPIKELPSFHKITQLTALGADVNAWPMSVQVLSHCRIVAEHFAAAFMWTSWKRKALARSNRRILRKLTNTPDLVFVGVLLLLDF